ncbi:MAG: two-component system NarL family sensor kinase [Cocleimonas sp.]|jgi:two-component system NarL family sensor kinase
MLRALPYKTKIALLTLIPLIFAIVVIAISTVMQTTELAKIQAQNFEKELISLKEKELKNYLELAYTAIINIYEDSSLEKTYAQKEAYYTLKKMEFGQDGYFFVYDYDGINIAHPRKPELEGKNLFNLKDERGNLMIQNLITQAKTGGGYTRYLWDKPSGGKSIEKLGYSIGLDRWNWMIGTGIYIDDIEKGVAEIEAKAEKTIRNTLLLTSLIAIMAILTTALVGFLINLSASRLASKKMRALTHKTVNFQEDERKRVSRELHDGINQLLVSVRYKLDNARNHLEKSTITNNIEIEKAQEIITEADDILSSGIQEVRRISRDLRPTVLDDLGLSSALNSLLNDFSERTDINVKYHNETKNEGFSYEIETAFYRIVQEALTNIEKHAKSAENVILTIKQKRHFISLSIANDGIGFNKQTLEKTNPDRGLGLRNMVDRTELLEGHLTVNSSLDKGTTVIVNIPV